jgi:hypothetical protein
MVQTSRTGRERHNAKKSSLGDSRLRETASELEAQARLFALSY